MTTKKLNLKRIREILWIALLRAREERVTQVAGSLTFTSVLSLVPMLTIALALFTAFPLFRDARDAFQQQWLADVLPPQISAQVLGYINLFAAKAKGLTAVGLIFLIVTAISMMLTLDKVLNEIWHVKRRRPLGQRVLVYWAAITLGPVLLGASLSATSYLRSAMGLDIPGLSRFLLEALPIVVMGLAFAALYVVVPNRLVLWPHALIGGAFAAITFELMKTGFAWYISRFPTYTAVYGAFAALPIFFLWIYLSWLVTLFGAALTAALPSLRYEKAKKLKHPGERFINALLILRELYQARQSLPQPGLRREQLIARLRISADSCDQLLDHLDELGLVARLDASGRTERWALICDPAETRLHYLYEKMAFERHYFATQLNQYFPALEGWLQQLVSEPALQVDLASLFESPEIAPN
ncbi:YihY family inner membrane protein [Parvibium lacunae]|uniref:UPF0761 membrane protein DU000_00915 n=1 Tax=Parvibium lacunae TaxID=1888893 RepID=A0A368L6U4_9BURK|nr:YihY family inner membrane protein [Parvibium lacunae]RCS59334.1 YihY family inner membrane protein [Parvibium lacunae]